MAPAALAGVAAPPPRLAAFRPARSSSSLACSRRGAAVLVCGDGEARNVDLRSAADAALECALSSHPARLLPASVLQQCCGRAPWRCQAPASPCRPSTLSSRVAARAWAGRWRPSSCGPATTWSSALATVGSGLRRCWLDGGAGAAPRRLCLLAAARCVDAMLLTLGRPDFVTAARG